MNGQVFSNDLYNAACSYALAGNKDKAFEHLYSLANGKFKYKKINHITNDIDLAALRKDERWGELILIVKQNNEEYLKNYDENLAQLLDSVYYMDQEVLLVQKQVGTNYGWDSDTLNQINLIRDSIFEITQSIVTKVIDERGWLGPEIVGRTGNSALFLVIQHANLELQLKYLPIMKEAANAGKLRRSSLALLEDRINLRQGKKQIYGSQIGRLDDNSNYVKPLIDPGNVDKRRASVGLEPLNDYTQYWNFNFNLEEYKQKLPMYEKLLEEEVKMSLAK